MADSTETAPAEGTSETETDTGTQDTTTDETTEVTDEEASDTDKDTKALKATLDKVRAEKRAATKELNSLRSRIQELETKDLSEKERLERERDDLRSKLEAFEAKETERTARAALTAAARKAGATGPERVAKLVPLADLDVEDDKAVKAAVAQVRDEFPELFAKPGPADSGAGKGGTAPSDPNAAFRAALLGR